MSPILFGKPSGQTVRLMLGLVSAIAICALFLHYDRAELLEKVLLVILGRSSAGLPKLWQPEDK